VVEVVAVIYLVKVQKLADQVVGAVFYLAVLLVRLELLVKDLLVVMVIQFLAQEVVAVELLP
jgi:hypothetical protein